MLHTKHKFFEFIVLILIISTSGHAEWTLVNLDNKCMFCLCEAATGCDMDRPCIEQYCGPYKLSKPYWVDAGNITMYADDYRRAGAFEACANDYYCARRIVNKYLAKYARDCNDDGVTNCYDFLMINFSENQNCKSMEREADGVNWLRRYTKCMEA